MLTPLEIQNRDFSKSLNGYNKHDVDEFMAELSRDLELHIIHEENMTQNIKNLESQLSNFLSIEESLKGALVIAQSTAEDVKRNANEKAKLIIGDAESEARRIIDDANAEALKVRHQIVELKKEYTSFQMRFKTLVKSQLDVLEKMTID